MKDQIKTQLAEKLKALKPGQQITLKNAAERQMCFQLVRAFRVGSVIKTRIKTTANGDGTFEAMAFK